MTEACVLHLLQAVYEVLFQTKIKIYGEVPSHEVSTLMIMNHRTRFDWLYLFSYQVRFGSVRRYTISLKNMLKFLPGIGKTWKMLFSCHLVTHLSILTVCFCFFSKKKKGNESRKRTESINCMCFVTFVLLFCVTLTFLFLFVSIFEKAREFIVLYHFYVL